VRPNRPAYERPRHTLTPTSTHFPPRHLNMQLKSDSVVSRSYAIPPSLLVVSPEMFHTTKKVDESSLPPSLAIRATHMRTKEIVLLRPMNIRKVSDEISDLLPSRLARMSAPLVARSMSVHVPCLHAYRTDFWFLMYHVTPECFRERRWCCCLGC
jgi:hypothetical protein